MNGHAAPDAAARSRVVASWQRCTMRHGLDPATRAARRVLSAGELRRCEERHAAILAHSMRPMAQLSDFLSPYCAWVGYAAADGVILSMHAREGHGDYMHRWGLEPGVDWSEPVEGTNGIGTCLVDEAPLIINSDEHFFARDAVMTCVAAPIFDHEGHIGGVLNVSLYGPDVGHESRWLVASLLGAAARQVESDHFHATYAACRIVSLAGLGRTGQALLAVDRDDVVCGATRAARQGLKLTERRLRLGVCAGDVMAVLGQDDADDLDTAERASLRRALVRSGGNVSAAGRTLGLSRATMKRKIKMHALSTRAPSAVPLDA